MIRVTVLGLAIDVQQRPVILLGPVDDALRADKAMPVWIGAQETASIVAAIQGTSIGRPLTHDLMATLLEATGSHIDRVTIPQLVDGTFYAEVELSTPNGKHVLDARPSDSIALAVRVGAEVWVADDVFDEVAVETEGTPQPTEEEEIAEFKDFVDHVDPDDFNIEGDKSED
ncbi:bifunctional nuclease family protein [Gulosibacter chungangensis]|uniref:Bifunctional nuclease family protein n=1 Tax=Gulosibacter chungangensis TaxID=979746 RepID=A0A7J5BCK0_9MICO|nr:bifunctional nuclease family protein [Gulosibacter chungangensis]KAB1643935.1 bifunctional nuclease family protein [Gulosibacter chungangensis]